MYETITVVGTVATVPERVETSSGIPIARFKLAVNQRRLEHGQWVDTHTNWYRVSAYRKLGEHALQSIQKGQRVVVTGRFRVSQWDNNGKSGMSADIDADALGHDLLWGTSQFQPDARPRQAEERPGTTETWPTTVPGGTAEQASPFADDPPSDDRAPELVAAGGWQAPLNDDRPY
ncbi:MAG: single-stranded DNA-binding protein [Microbacterium sp.]